MQIEIKVKIKDVKKIKAKILSLGAKFKEETEEDDFYFYTKKGVFKLKITNNTQYFLIHDYRPKTTITTAFRTEVPLDKKNGEKIFSILKETVGIKFCLLKKRCKYQKDFIEFAIDSIKDHDTFLEILSPNVSTGEVWETKRHLLNILEEFGFTENDCENKSYIDFYNHD